MNVWRRKEQRTMSDSNNYKMQLAEKFSKNEIKFLDEKSEFEFACDQCGKCCHNRDDILLTPLDLFHMVKATGKDIKDVISKYGDTYVGDSSHLPIVRLRYREEPDGSTTCYFLGRKDGKAICRIHDNKPTVCRIYPLGKMVSMKPEDETETLDLKPKYFLQDEPEECCAGLARAHREHEKQVLVDWVGGKEKMQTADRYSEIFNAFMVDYSKALKFDDLIKNKPETARIFFPMIALKIYYDYDFGVDDAAFLRQMKRNLDDVLWLTRLVADKNPQELLKLIQSRKDGDASQSA